MYSMKLCSVRADCSREMNGVLDISTSKTCLCHVFDDLWLKKQRGERSLTSSIEEEKEEEEEEEEEQFPTSLILLLLLSNAYTHTHTRASECQVATN